MMKQRLILAFALAFLFQSIPAQTPFSFSTHHIAAHINYLASDSLKGRQTGTPECFLAAEYIRDQWESFGLKLLGDDGFQRFEVVTGIKPGDNNQFQIEDRNLEMGVDFTSLPFSKNAGLTSTATFVGYGFEIENDDFLWNDYADADVSGKWAVILRGAPESNDNDAEFGSTDERFKVMIAQDNGAAGVIFITGEQIDSDDALMPLNYDRSPATAGIPVFQLRRSVADEFLFTGDLSVAALEQKIADNLQSASFYIDVNITAQADLEKQKVDAHNVVAMIEGSDPALHEQYVVMGAHFDHLGMGGFGSGSRVPDTHAPHYGADDNASGVAAIIELARYFALRDHAPERSLLFIAFDAEEMGLVGSRYFVNNSLVDLSRVTAMLNFDMIGRMRGNNMLTIGGTGTSLETQVLLDQLAAGHPLEFVYSQQGFGPSDHAAFYSKDIPVFFITTGAHSDYHTPRDTPDEINLLGMKKVLDFSADLIADLSAQREMLTFQEAGPSQREGHRYNFKVTLGIMPDMTSSGNDGLKVEAVRPGAPAASGGMKKGDIITAIDGNPVGNIYDYMGRLKSLEAGQVITVDVLREEKLEVLIIQL